MLTTRTVDELLLLLRQRDVVVSLHGDRLRVSAPQGSIDEGLRAELAARRDEILERLRADASAPSSERSGSAAAPSSAPLSFQQERMWLLEQLHPGHVALNVPLTMRLRGSLDRSALEQAIAAIVRRHGTLRTSFVPMPDGARQVIAPEVPTPLRMVDLTTVTGDPRAEADRLAAECTSTPFDLTRPPLLRVLLARIADEEHLLHIVVHHAVCDGWSLTVLARELGAQYNAFEEGHGTPVAPLPLQYADFARQQRIDARSERMAQHAAYWRQRLAGSPRLLELPTDFPRPPARAFRSGRARRSLPADLVSALRRVGAEQGATLFTVLMAAFQVLLSRHSGQSDVCVGFPVAGRVHPDLEGLIGVFSNSLPLRTDLSGDPTFEELLARVKRGIVEAQAHQEAPFEHLIEALQVERSLSHTPIFQVALNFLSFGLARPEMRNIQAESWSVPGTDAHFDLTLYLIEQEGGLECALVYDASLFTATRAEWWLEQFETLTREIGLQPARPISRLPLVRSRPSRPARVAPSVAFEPFAAEDVQQSIASRFEWQVARGPQRIAARTGADEWTYARLNDTADRIAAALVQHTGTVHGQVALLFEHDVPMIAAILGALKAGKAYVPLDTAHPPARLSHILADSASTAVLTDSANADLAARVSAGAVPIIDVDVLADVAVSCQRPHAGSEGHAYILYTSGSTGRPKGVIQSHGNVLRHIRNYTNALHIGPGDHLTLLASYGFDAAVMAIFGALLNGATLHPFALRREGLAPLGAWLGEQGITIYHSTPTVFEHFARSVSAPAQLGAVRAVVLGGEEVRWRHVEQFKRCFQRGTVLVNGLGPTECTLGLQCFLDHDTPAEGLTVPVGFPVEDVEAVLLDDRGEPTDVRGEIAFRSTQVAVGYWRQHELTTASFSIEPGAEGRRLYRTGDVGRLRPDGALEFVGRRDFQVKVRGIRVEPAEVETVLTAHPAVQDAVVVARIGSGGDTRLVAYVTWRHGVGGETKELIAFLRGRLPEYMVPAAIVPLDALPTTPNGKVDRRALPDEPSASAAVGAAPAAARTPVEQVLTIIWAETLGRESVGVRDSFFELGGDSLLATQLVSRIRQEMGRDLPLSALFESPTIEEMARRLAPGAPAPPSSPVVTFNAGSTALLPLFLVHGFGGGVWDYRQLAGSMPQDRPVHGLVAKGDAGDEEPLDVLEAIAADSIRAMRSVHPTGPYAIGGYCYGGVVAFEMARQLERDGERVALLAILDGYAPLHGRRKFRLPSLVNFALNLPRWLGAFASTEHAAILARVRRTGRVLLKLAARRLGARVNIGLEDALDETAHVPDLQRKVMESQIRAQINYAPQPCATRITVFRVKGQSIWRVHDPTLGWGELSSGGANVVMIEGAHLKILHPPYVQQVATQLEEQMRNATVSAGETA